MKATAIILATGLLVSTAFSAKPSNPTKDIVDTAVAAGQFKTLATALEAADLIKPLKGEGPFTVFAPTDEAFAKLPEPILKALLKPSNKDVLASILTYHVVPAEVPFTTAVGLDEAKALSGEKLSIQVKEGRLVLNESKVIANDIKTTNGIIHVIDTVLLPPSLDLEKLSAVHGDTSDLVNNAIDKGSILFDHGQRDACAAVYDIALQAVLQQEGGRVDVKLKKQLVSALSAKSGHCSNQHRAWEQRHALEAYLSSAKRMSMKTGVAHR